MGETNTRNFSYIVSDKTQKGIEMDRLAEIAVIYVYKSWIYIQIFVKIILTMTDSHGT